MGPNTEQLLALRPVVVGVEGRVVEVEEPQPVSPRHVRVATDRVILKQIFSFNCKYILLNCRYILNELKIFFVESKYFYST